MMSSLRNKLLVALLCSTILPILIVCVVVGFNIKKNSLTSFFATTGSELGQIDKAISVFLDSAEKSISLLAKHPAVIAVDSSINSYLDKKEPKSSKDLPAGEIEKPILDLTRTMLASNGNFIAIYAATIHGGFSMASDDPLPPGYDPRIRPWYKAAEQNKGKPTVSKAYQSTTGDVVLTAAHTVVKGEQMVGVVGIDLTLAELTNFIKTIKIGKSGYVMLVQDDGVILADPRVPENNFKKLGDVGGEAFKLFASTASGDLRVTIKDKDYAAKIITSPKFGWKLIGLIDYREIMAEVYSTLWIIALIGLAVTLVFGGVGIFLARSLARPINTTTLMIKDIAEGQGDLTKRIPMVSRDELGTMATWFNAFLDNLQTLIKEISVHASVVDSSSGKLLGIATLLAANSRETSTKAGNVATSAAAMSQAMNSVATTMEETTSNTSVVASAVEEMASTINEIAKNSEMARSISAKAVSQAASASSKMSDLGQAASAISAVTETITEISEQTNLLALNATIEAARAGEAGKGFAVVANEIKELAKQTAAATAEIKSKIDGVQGTTRATVSEIEAIGKVINDINDIIASIATAIEEQSVATNEIANNVSQASQGISEVNASIADSTMVIQEIDQEVSAVNRAAEDISGNSHKVEDNANELKRLAHELGALISRFTF